MDETDSDMFLVEDDKTELTEKSGLNDSVVIYPSYNLHVDAEIDMHSLSRSKPDPPSLKSTPVFEISGKQVSKIDFVANTELFQLYEQNYLSENYHKSLEHLRKIFDEYDWMYLEIDNENVSQWLDSDVFIIPPPKYEFLTDKIELLEVQRDLEFGVLDMVSSGVDKDEIARKYQLTLENIDKIILFFNENGRLPSDRVVSAGKKKRSVVLPKYSDIKKILDQVYKSKKYSPNSWNSFYRELSAKFPNIAGTPRAYKKFAKAYEIKKVKAKVVRRRPDDLKVLTRALMMRLVCIRYMFHKDSPILFYHAFRVDVHQIPFKAIGNNRIRPVYIIQEHRPIYIHLLLGKYGLFSAQVTADASTDTKLSFLKESIATFYKRQPDSTLLIAFDNSIEFKRQWFATAIGNIGVGIIYLSYPEHMTNMACMYEQSLLRHLSRFQILNVEIAIMHVRVYILNHINKCWWIHRRYHNQTLHMLQKYRGLQKNANIPLDVNSLVMGENYAHLWDDE